jgi:FMN phosphatase YigB (HAD superfamily)
VSLTHIFFDVHDVLVDRTRLGELYTERLGVIMTERYGFTPTAWTTAYRQILADWDSYYADLNLSGDDGIADMWEGIYRTTRALFRLTGAPEPEQAELTAISRELPGLAAQGGDVLYPEVPEVVERLNSAGLTLGVISHSLINQIHASLAPILHHFKGPIWGADNAGRFDKDVQRFQSAALSAGAVLENCLMLDDKQEPLLNARRAGMRTIQIRRDPSVPAFAVDAVLPDLRGLIDYSLSPEQTPR